jgi:hypothetical protein
MLAFIIPLKSAKVSKDWEKTSALFERCLHSVCNQTSKEFKTIVVCNELPKVSFHHESIEYVQVDFIPPEKENNPITKADTDKGRRIFKGILYAQKFSPTHIMSVDADDCVSNQLAQFVLNNRDSESWYFDSGWKYRDGEPVIYFKRSSFYTMSGTSNIISNQCLSLPSNPEFNRGYGYYKFYIDHQKIKDKLEKRSFSVSRLPFPGAVYILSTGDNISGNENKLSFNFLNKRKLSQKIHSEFCLY